MRARGGNRSIKFAFVTVAIVMMPAVALAQEDHSHGEGSLLWPCGVFMASVVTAALSFGGFLLQTRTGGGSTMGMSALFDIPWSRFLGQQPAPIQQPPASGPFPMTGQAFAEEPQQNAAAPEPEYQEEPDQSATDRAPEQDEPAPKKADTPVTPDEARKAPGHADTRYNPVTKQIEVRTGDTWVQAGLKGGYYGKGGGPGHDPFKDAPPVADARIGDVTLHKRGDMYSGKTQTGRSGADTTLKHNAADGTTSFSRKDFSLTNRDRQWTLFDKVGGDTMGVRFDGSTKDFTLWRNRFSLDHKGDAWSAANLPKKGTGWTATFDPAKDTYAVTVGDRGIGRKGSEYVADWGNAAAGVDTQHNRYTFGHVTGRGNVYHEYTAGRDGQTGFTRTQGVKLFGKKAELNAGFENYLKSVGGSEQMTRQRSVGLDTGGFKLEFIREDGRTSGSLVKGAFVKRF